MLHLEAPARYCHILHVSPWRVGNKEIRTQESSQPNPESAGAWNPLRLGNPINSIPVRHSVSASSVLVT